MKLSCPHCQFSKEIPDGKIPSATARVTCPQCKQSFTLAAQAAPSENLPRVECPACQLAQPKADSCSGCGLIFAKYRPSQPMPSPTSPGDKSPERLQDKPKAGFWLRLVALMIDCFLVFLLQIIFGFLLMFVSGNGFNFQGSISLLIQLFSSILSLFYWVFFTGYSGQTPGKMLLRIKVVVADGSAVSYGKAFYREIVGKFISGIILGIGYLMAAFDDQKQGLHDRMAKTYVIKL